jgi:hypothetical protein
MLFEEIYNIISSLYFRRKDSLNPPPEPLSNGPSNSALDNLKVEIMNEVRQELQKMKVDIINGNTCIFFFNIFV